MGHDITPDPIDTDNVLAVPDNGDDLDADVVNAVFEVIANGLRSHRRALTAHIAWSGDFAVTPGGSLTSFSLSVGGIDSLFAEDEDGNYRQGAAPPTGLDQTYIEGGGNTLGAVARWWFVYAFNTNADAGGVAVIDYAISLTPPDSARHHKGSDESRVYLGCFCTTSTGAPLPMRKAAGRCLYRRSGIASVTALLASGGLRAVDTASAVGRTVINLSTRCPPHARVALLQAHVAILTTGSGSGAVNLYTADDTTGVALSVAARSASFADIAENTSSVEVELTSAQLCAYSVTESTAGAYGDIDVLGWLE